MHAPLRPLTLLFALAGPAAAQAPVGTWTLLPGPPQTGSRFDDGSFVSPDTGFVIFSGGQGSGLYATEDGGATWRQTLLPVGPRSVGFATDSIGWVGTLFGSTNQHLFETRDGGRTFTNVADRITGDPVLGVCGLSVVSTEVVYGAGWCCGGGAGILKTADGGQTWQATRLDSLVDFLIDVHFFDENRGVAVGGSDPGPTGQRGRAAVIGTEDGGATWALRHVSADSMEWGWKIPKASRHISRMALMALTERGRAPGWVTLQAPQMVPPPLALMWFSPGRRDWPHSTQRYSSGA